MGALIKLDEPNTELEFVDVLYVDGGTKTKRWQAIDFVFKGREFIRYRLFAPSSYKDRREISDRIRHICEVLGANYDSIPYQHNWDELTLEIIKLLRDKIGTKVFGKIIEKHDRITFSDELPFLSLEPNLVYKGTDYIYTLGTSNMSAAGQRAVEAIEKAEKAPKPTKQELAEKRQSGNLPF